MKARRTEVYDVAQDTWRVLGTLPKGVVASAVGAVVGAGGAPLLLSTGGLETYVPLGDPVAAVSESSDGGAAWAAGPSMAQARTYHGVAVIGGNGTAAGGPRRLFAVGGSRLGDASNATGALASVEVFVM